MGWLAVRAKARLTVRVDQRRVAAKPLRVTATASVRPRPGDAIPSVDSGCSYRRSDRSPGDNGISGGEDFVRDSGFDVGCGHRAAGRLGHAPCSAGIGFGDLLDGGDECYGIAFFTAAAPRQQHFEQACIK